MNPSTNHQITKSPNNQITKSANPMKRPRTVRSTPVGCSLAAGGHAAEDGGPAAGSARCSQRETKSAPAQGGRGRQASEGRRLRLRGHKPQPRVAKGGQTWPDTLWGQSLLWAVAENKSVRARPRHDHRQAHTKHIYIYIYEISIQLPLAQITSSGSIRLVIPSARAQPRALPVSTQDEQGHWEQPPNIFAYSAKHRNPRLTYKTIALCTQAFFSNGLHNDCLPTQAHIIFLPAAPVETNFSDALI